jgi:hypothetical protein
MRLEWHDELEYEYVNPNGVPSVNIGERYWELIDLDNKAVSPFKRVLADIRKVGKRKYQLAVVLKTWARGTSGREVSYHTTLKEAKALGLVNARIIWSN